MSSARLRPLFARVLVLVATVSALLAALVPTIASGHEDHAVERAIAHDAMLAAELAQLPRETPGEQCLSTERVPGIGEACRTVEGQFRVQLASGATVVTHGTDAPVDLDANGHSDPGTPHLTASQDAVDTADVGDIECITDPWERRIELVYAYPQGSLDRTATIAPALRSEIYRASAFLDAESQALDSAEGRRLRVLCDGGEPVVHTVELTIANHDYSEVVDALVAEGFPDTSNRTSPRRFVVFYDAESAHGAAGTAALSYDDEAGVLNQNNKGARYAVEFAWDVVPHWDVLLHEISHNMGAVQTSASVPGGNELGHCDDGLDIMCYDEDYSDDPATDSYDPDVCAVERYDCNGDSYFDPSPAPGEWLATHWNVGATSNVWLAARFAEWTGPPDTTPPDVPTGLTAIESGMRRIDVDWNASVDDLSTSVRYDVTVEERGPGDASFSPHSTWDGLADTDLQLSDLVARTTYRVAVAARDQAGNASSTALVELTMSATPPATPAAIVLSISDVDVVTAAWTASTSGAQVRGYEVQLQRDSGDWSGPHEQAATSANFGSQLTGTYRGRVRAIDVDGIPSDWRTSVGTVSIVSRAFSGMSAPVPTVRRRGASTADLEWTAVGDAASYRVQVTRGAGIVQTKSTTATSLLLTGLAPNTSYVAHVVAIDASGVETEPGSVDLTTTRDSTPPSRLRLKGSPMLRGARLVVRWLRPTDDVGVARYQLEYKAGRAWKPVKVSIRATSITIRGVRPGAKLRFRALDAAGNAAPWTSFTAPRRR